MKVLPRSVSYVGLVIGFTLLFLTPAHAITQLAEDELFVMFWNLENLFDWKDSGQNDADAEFSSTGKRHWTRSRFDKKINMIAKSILWTGDQYGRIPDVIGFAEIENRGVINRLLYDTVLDRAGYKIVHEESADPRGIDVGLIYLKDKLRLVEYDVFRPEGTKTRDILYVCLESAEGRKYSFFVNHHPSKFSGASASDKKRTAVMRLMVSKADSLIQAGCGTLISMGDFNDSPSGKSFEEIGEVLENKSLTLYKKGDGTIKFAGKWDLIDMFMTSPGCDSQMYICRLPFLMTPDRKYGGMKPFRTYSGPRYIGGVSDHCPIILICH